MGLMILLSVGFFMKVKVCVGLSGIGLGLDSKEMLFS